MLTRRDASWTQGTHITFRNLGKMNGSRGYQRKTNIYEVLEKGGGVSALLGTIKWFGRWRKYCFYPVENTIYEETCLRDISQFIEEETKAHRASGKKVKACGHCKHPDHPQGDCEERVCDAAGDIDWCPCSYGTAKRKAARA